ncbi:hypothetical protein GONAM_15_01240 [Gordonia namibiensis NBRC 108229]|uniref:Uncharacterized protein n=1 Tax=Gordonia namibiensis NBRC 108229 TaxID=1208314 RepID=K6XNM0_9ACTN|nr:hypothetical protein GONAM_15_01240 [Gordonia namibiensis NBRC 108229]
MWEECHLNCTFVDRHAGSVRFVRACRKEANFVTPWTGALDIKLENPYTMGRPHYGPVTGDG